MRLFKRKNTQQGNVAQQQTTGAQKQASQTQQQAQPIGSGGSTFGTTILVKLQQHKSKVIWVVLILAAVLAGFVWWFGWAAVKSFALKYLLKITIIIIYLIISVLVFINDKDKKTATVVLIPYIIWFIDTSTLFGPIYQGFQFNPSILTQTNWTAVITSSLVSGLLIFNVFNKWFRRDLGFIVSMLLFAGINYISGKISPNLSPNLYSIFPIILAAFGILLLYIFHKQGFTFSGETLSYLVMVLVFSYFWVNWNWTANPKAVLHVGWVIIFCLGYLSTFEGIEGQPFQKGKLYLFTPVFLILDFFGSSLLSAYGITVPLIVLVTCFYGHQFAKNSFARWNGLTLLVLLTVLSYTPTTLAAQSVNFQEREATDTKSPFQTISDFFSRIGASTSKKVEQRLDYASGGYSSSVEKNQYESLGVYFADPRAGEPVFYTYEPVVVWATIRSKTYQDPVVVKFECYRKEKEVIEKGIPKPDIPFPVFQLEENDVECKFAQIPNPGPTDITLRATYNFATNAYLKTYFIDRETYRALTRQGIEDPLAQFAIKDKEPKPVFTNGPVQIGINIGPIIHVAQTYNSLPRLTISLQNRQSIEDKDKRIVRQWEGKINEIKELVILTPPDVTILIGDPNACNKPFAQYTPERCSESCTTFVSDPCAKACQTTDQICQNECKRLADECKNECENLFKVDTGQGPAGKPYNAYYLDLSKIKQEDYKDIDSQKFRTFSCLVNPAPEVLDKTPITTRYFRVRARYEYLLENTVQVNIEQSFETLGTLDTFINSAVAKPEYSGMDPNLVKALMIQESGVRHCRNDAAECPPDQVVRSDSSVGIMQINIRDKPFDEWKEDASDVCNTLSPKTDGSKYTVYDLDCNILLGIYVLQQKYAYYGGTSKSYKCSGYPTKTYTSWEAAVRGYNGWGCPPRGDWNFVEDVMELKRLVDNDLIKEAHQRRLQRLGIDKLIPKSPYIVEPPPATNAADTPNKGNSITITWTASPTTSDYPNIRYRVERFRRGANPSTDRPEASFDNIAGTSYEDTGVTDNVEYFYLIFAHTENEDSTSVRAPSSGEIISTP